MTTNRKGSAIYLVIAFIFMLAIAPINLVKAQDNARLFQSGKTTINFNQTFSSSLNSLSISTQALGTSKINGSTAVIMGIDGLLDLNPANSEFLHTGGLQFTSGQNTIQLMNFIVTVSFDTDFREFEGDISANVIINNQYIGRVSIFDLGVKSIGVTGNGKFMINNLDLTLTGEAVATFNDQFNTTIFNQDQVVGVASIKGKLK